MTVDAPHTGLDEEIAACAALCRRALDGVLRESVECLPDAPKTPEACFALLSGAPYAPRSVRVLRRLKAAAATVAAAAPYAVERYVVLQSYLAALPRLRLLPLDDSTNWQFCTTCRLVASPAAAPEPRLALDGDAFAELAQIVTLRRFHAGQLSFETMDIPRAWLLKIHPAELARVVWEDLGGFRGRGPVVMPHVNYWRANTLLLLQSEQERSLLRIASYVERQPDIKGLVSSSWLYCAAMGKAFPHLAWLRDFFLDNDARVVDAGPALEDAGFLVGSEQRKRLYAGKRLHPRETLVFWRRANMLTWADAYRDAARVRRSQDLSTSRRQAAARTATNRRFHTDRRWRSGRCTLIDCKRWLYYKPWQYGLGVLLLPALAAATLASVLWSVGTALPIAIVTLAFMWLAQYFFLQ